MPRKFRMFSSQAKKIVPETAAPLADLPVDLWLLIYSYLHPMQLVEFALLSKTHFGITQTKDYFQSVVWQTLFKQFFPDFFPSANYHQEFHRLYTAELDKIPENLRNVFIFMVLGHLDTLKKELTKLAINPGQLLYVHKPDEPVDSDDDNDTRKALAGDENSFLWKIQKTNNPAIYKIFYDVFHDWYNQQRLSDSFPPRKLDEIRDSAGNSIQHWQAALHQPITGVITPDLVNLRGESPETLAAAMDNTNFPWTFTKASVFGQAIYYHSANTVELFFENLDKTEKNLSEIFYAAVLAGRHDLIRRLWLLRQNDAIKLSDDCLKEAFKCATLTNQIDTLSLLMEIAPANYFETAFERDYYGNHPLYRAIKFNWHEVLEALLTLYKQKKIGCDLESLAEYAACAIRFGDLQTLKLFFNALTSIEMGNILQYEDYFPNFPMAGYDRFDEIALKIAKLNKNAGAADFVSSLLEANREPSHRPRIWQQ